jgi:hypothetical protein
MIKNRYTAAITDKPWWLAGGIPQSACVAAYQPKGASSYEASKVNLANPIVYTLENGTEYPTWDTTTGWKGNGTSQYLTITGGLPIPETGASAILISGNSAAGATFYQQAYLSLLQSNAPNARFYWGHNSGIGYISGNQDGVFATSYYKPGYFRRYLNCVKQTLAGEEYINGGNIGGNMFIFSSTGLASFSNVYIKALVFYNIGITPQQVVALTNAMNAL